MIAKFATGVLAIGLAFGANLLMRPNFDLHYDAAECAQQVGSMTVMRGGAALEIPLMAAHIVTKDVERLGRRYPIREFIVRAATTADAAPRMELFVSLAESGGDLAGGAHDPSVLAQHELPLLAAGRPGARSSYVVLSGTTRSAIVSGSLYLTDVAQTSTGSPAEYTAQGRVELQVQTDTGVDMVTGKWSARVVWDATGT
jgi:hypothetical protein